MLTCVMYSDFTNSIGIKIYKYKTIMGRTDFSDQFRKVRIHYKGIGYSLNEMRPSACLVINPISFNNFAALFNYKPMDRMSGSMMVPT